MTRAQRRWHRKGVCYEMIPLRPKHGSERISYVLGPHESWRAQRAFARDVLHMPVRPICMQLLHNGRKP